jgi:YegS/Rv2252/BmrU family lipid kinase
MKPVVILNPAAGAGRAGRAFEDARRTLEAGLGPVEVRATERPGHAADLARAALASGAGRILVAGGDGTLHEVVNGWFRDGLPVNPAAALGLLPCGTGSDFARTLGLPRDPTAAAAAIARAAPRPLDAGRFRSRGPGGAPRDGWFVNNLGFGIGGVVAAIANASPKWLGGFASFFLATVRAFQVWRDRAVRLDLDGVPRQARITLCSVCNGRTAGGGMVLGPDASPFDGRLDLALMEGLRLHDFLGRFRYLYGGLPLQDPRISRLRVSTLRAEATDGAGPVPITADGEDGGYLPVEITVMPGALRMLVVEDAPRPAAGPPVFR